jgi:beta-N-acetylhexosaminidase
MRWVGNLEDPAFTREVGRALALECRAVGFDLDFAPDADVDSNPKNPIIGDRAFSPDPRKAGRQVRAFIEGMQSEHCIACAKHFPGHGDTTTDSHLELPVVEKDPPDLDQVELIPFRAAIAAGVGTVMTAHVMYPGWDEKLPATMSSTIMRGILRERLGFQGLIISDDLEMKAVRGRFPLEQQLETATLATVDTFLACKELSLVVEAYETLVRLQEQDKRQEDEAIDSVRRLHRTRERFLKGRPPAPGLEILGSHAHRELAMRAQALGRA